MNKPEASKTSIALKHKAADCRKLHDFLSKNIQAKNMSTETRHDLRLVIEEIFSNIVNHADITSQDNEITVELNHSIRSISITFTDTGKAFNPLCDHENCMHENDHSEGGMGVHLIKSLTDHQEYKRIKQQNVFTVTKHYNQ